MRFKHTIAEHELATLRSGTHVYAYRFRFLTLYTHHAVVFRRRDHPPDLHSLGVCYGWDGETPRVRALSLEDEADEMFVVEQNRAGLQLATIECFRQGFKAREFLYGVPSFEYAIKRAGSCSILPRLEQRAVVENIVTVLRYPRGWETYQAMSANCEHFALAVNTMAEFSAQVSAMAVALRDIVGGAIAATSQALNFVREK